MLVSEVVHPSSMNFRNQRKLMILRDQQKLEWSAIPQHLWTLSGQHPSERQCRSVHKAFNANLGRRVYGYARCGRSRWKVTPEVSAFLVRKLLALRTKCICTSSVLQHELAHEMRVTLACSTIRKILQHKGYHWLPRRQKRRYGPGEKQQRRDFAADVLAMPQHVFCKHVSMSMDGVILSVPPENPTQRVNYCHVGDTHMWRKRSEAATPELAGGGDYGAQIPPSRIVPMWGGVGPGGFGLIAFHAKRKLNQHEWAQLVRHGKLTGACKAVRPDRAQGPWHILCDNESFLSAPAAAAAHARARVELWHIPPRSPDLNPVEKFWSWLRARLRAMDLADLKARRVPVRKAAFKARVRSLVRTARAKRVSANIFKGLRKTCAEVLRKRGAGSRS